MSNSHDFFKKYQSLFEGKECSEEKADDKKEKADKNADNYKKGNVRANWGDKAEGGPGSKPKNTKESAGEFFRRYADIITEAEEDDEDPDVAAADKVKGKDGKTQKDADKNLPPWLKKNMDKKDKDDEDKGAKKAKKDKESFAEAKMKE